MDGLQMSQSNATQRGECDEAEEESEEAGLFELRQDCRMTSILQEALYKCEEVIALLAER